VKPNHQGSSKLFMALEMPGIFQAKLVLIELKMFLESIEWKHKKKRQNLTKSQHENHLDFAVTLCCFLSLEKTSSF
jgi:hypothetical protein